MGRGEEAGLLVGDELVSQGRGGSLAGQAQEGACYRRQLHDALCVVVTDGGIACSS